MSESHVLNDNSNEHVEQINDDEAKEDGPKIQITEEILSEESIDLSHHKVKKAKKTKNK